MPYIPHQIKPYYGFPSAMNGGQSCSLPLWCIWTAPKQLKEMANQSHLQAAVQGSCSLVSQWNMVKEITAAFSLKGHSTCFHGCKLTGKPREIWKQCLNRQKSVLFSFWLEIKTAMVTLHRMVFKFPFSEYLAGLGSKHSRWRHFHRLADWDSPGWNYPASFSQRNWLSISKWETMP